MITFVFYFGKEDAEPLTQFLREQLGRNPVGMAVMMGGYSGYVTYQDYIKNEAMIFALNWKHLCKAEEDLG